MPFTELFTAHRKHPGWVCLAWFHYLVLQTYTQSILNEKCQWVPIVEQGMLPRRWTVVEGVWEMLNTGLGAPLALAHLVSQELWECSCVIASIPEIKDSGAHRRWENCPRPGSEFHCELWSLIFRIQEAKQTSVACHSTVWGTYWALRPSIPSFIAILTSD